MYGLMGLQDANKITNGNQITKFPDTTNLLPKLNYWLCSDLCTSLAKPKCMTYTHVRKTQF